MPLATYWIWARATRRCPELRGFAPFVIDIYHVHVRSKHLKSQCLLYWKYSKLLCIRTLIKLSYHTSSVEAVHSQVIFFFYDNIQLFISFLLNFYFTFLVCYWFGNKVVVKILAAIIWKLFTIRKSIGFCWPRSVNKWKPLTFFNENLLIRPGKSVLIVCINVCMWKVSVKWCVNGQELH